MGLWLAGQDGGGQRGRIYRVTGGIINLSLSKERVLQSANQTRVGIFKRATSIRQRNLKNCALTFKDECFDADLTVWIIKTEGADTP
ncbi:hypothetical protein GCM10009611_21030 [Arthrobacter roseus]